MHNMDEDEEIIDIGDIEVKEDIQHIIETNDQVNETIYADMEPVTETTVDTWVSPSDDMDEESRQLIEQMLAEEEYYYGRDTISSLKKQNKRKPIKDQDYVTKKKAKKEGTQLSSAALPSHKTRWNEEEDKMLEEALEKFGYGNWRQISEYVKTRNPLQCKNHARHLQQTDKIQVKQQQQTPSPVKDETTKETDTTSKEIETPKEVKAPEIELPKEMHDMKEENKDEEEDIDLSIDDDEDNIDRHQLMNMPEPEADIPEEQEVSTAQDEEAMHDENTVQEGEAMQQEENATQENNIIQEIKEEQPVSPAPEEEFIEEDSAIPLIKDTPLFTSNEISQEEMIQNPEWFKNKHSKTPDRYLKIRNHMLNCWEACRPRYLTKTSARRGLKNCGDVNAIGRVHEYLESVGAINVDCVTNAPRPPRRREVFVENSNEEFDPAELVIGYDGPRKRKVRNEHGDWVDPKELEGRVIEHRVIVRLDSKPKRVARKFAHQHYYGGDDFSRGYDPFRLVPTSHYNEETPAPFNVEIQSDALLVMDFHSHLAHTEIIGLLGGNFIQRGDAKILQVKIVFPCKSTSTGIQCEMDPVSEMQARELFAEKGYNVVGWYHSHPTFEPHPSIRDIENQTSYQTLFREEKSGDEPFIGVIVTPYDPEITSDHSQIQYLHISKEWNEAHSFRIPYACRRTVIQSEQVSDDILHQFKALLKEYKDYEHKMDMKSEFGQQTRLDKLLDSLRTHLFLEKEQETKFLESVKQLVLDDFVDTPQQTNEQTT